MQSETRIYSLPRWRVTRWLADCGPGVPDDIRVELIGNLFGNLPVFVGGVINTVVAVPAPAPVVTKEPASPGAPASVTASSSAWRAATS